MESSEQARTKAFQRHFHDTMQTPLMMRDLSIFIFIFFSDMID